MNILPMIVSKRGTQSRQRILVPPASSITPWTATCPHEGNVRKWKHLENGNRKRISFLVNITSCIFFKSDRVSLNWRHLWCSPAPPHWNESSRKHLKRETSDLRVYDGNIEMPHKSQDHIMMGHNLLLRDFASVLSKICSKKCTVKANLEHGHSNYRYTHVVKKLKLFHVLPSK